MVTTRGKRVNYADIVHHSDDEEPRPVPKRRKNKHNDGDGDFTASGSGANGVNGGTGTKKRRSGGRARTVLDGFMDIPVDIFAEICLDLTPLDLLQLARSTRRLREILMSRSSKGLWKRARENVKGLPDCPEDLSEPQYASLMFEVGCQNCNKGTRKTDYTLRLRLCNNCLETKLMTWRQMSIVWPKMPWQFCDAIPNSWFGNKILYLASAFEQAHKELYPEKDSKDAVAEYVEKMQKGTRVMYETGRQMSIWKADEAYNQQQHKLELCEARESKIVDKLVELGWERGDMPTDSREWDTLVFKPTPLTDQTWNRIYPKLIPALEIQRTQRLAHERHNRCVDRLDDFYDYYAAWIAGEIAAHPNDNLTRGHFMRAAHLLAQVPALQRELEEEDVGSYAREKWEVHLGEVGRVNRAFRENVGRLMRGLVGGVEGGSSSTAAGPSSSSASGDAALTKLNKMTTIFGCVDCQKRFWYPEVLQHGCCIGKVETSLPGLIQYSDDELYFSDSDSDSDDMEFYGGADPYMMFAMAFGFTRRPRQRRRVRKSAEAFSVENLVVEKEDGEWAVMTRLCLRDLEMAGDVSGVEVEAQGNQFTSLLCAGGQGRNDAWSVKQVINHNCAQHDPPRDRSLPVIKRDTPASAVIPDAAFEPVEQVDW